MPLYDIYCETCGHEKEIFLALKYYDDLPECCGYKMKRKVCAPFVPQEFQPYKSMITGEIITDRGQHRRHLKAHNCVEVGNEKPAPRQEWKPSKQEQEALRRDISQRLEAARV